MHGLLSAVVFLIVAWGVSANWSRAQDDEGPAEPAAERKPYVPPAAWKSVEIGNFYLRGKKHNAALSRFQEAVKTDPYYSPGYLGLGKVYERIGLKQKAMEAYRKYLDTLPSAKEAEEAQVVHQAIARLERQLKTRRAPTRGRTSEAEATSRPP